MDWDKIGGSLISLMLAYYIWKDYQQKKKEGKVNLSMTKGNVIRFGIIFAVMIGIIIYFILRTFNLI